MKKSIVIIFIILSAYLYIFGGCTFNCIDKLQFSKNQWMKYDRDIFGSSDRLKMIPDLVCNKFRSGMKKGEVISMLGKPDSEYWSSYYPYPGWANGKYPGDSSVVTGVFIKFDKNNTLQDIYAPYWWGKMSYYSSPLGFLKCINT